MRIISVKFWIGKKKTEWILGKKHTNFELLFYFLCAKRIENFPHKVVSQKRKENSTFSNSVTKQKIYLFFLSDICIICGNKILGTRFQKRHVFQTKKKQQEPSMYNTLAADDYSEIKIFDYAIWIITNQVILYSLIHPYKITISWNFWL